MLNYEELLSKVYEDENVETVLEALDCSFIHQEQGGNLIVSARPTGDNKRSVQIVNDETLRAKVRSTGFYGDLISLVQYFMGFKYMDDAKQWVMMVCGYDEETTYEPPPLQWLNKIKRQRKHYELSYEMPILDEEILNQYLYGDIKQFNKDNISTNTLIKSKIGYDVTSKRITIPIRDINGNLVGVKGRTTIKDEESYWKFFYLYPCDQSKTLFNYHKAKDFALTKEIKVFESEKAPIQMEDMGVFDTVGIGSSNISTHQLNLLMQLNCDIILCPDKDLDLSLIIKTFTTFFEGKRNVYLVEDKFDILPHKGSPSDCGIDVWNKLYASKTLICKGE